MAIIGYDTIGSPDGIILDFDNVIGTVQARLLKNTAIVAASGDVATQFALYVTSGAGADSTIEFGLYVGASATDPSAFTRVFSETLVITAAMKASPGWKTKTINWDLTPYAGQTLRLAFAGVNAGSLGYAADGPGSASSIVGDSATLPTPWGTEDYGSGGQPSAYVTVTAGAGTTVTPAPASLTLNGRTPATSAFQNVRIRDVLVNESGQAVANAANITLLVWYGGVARGAPDVSLNGQTTDANGSASWSIPTGSLAFNQHIFYVAQDSVSFSNYTCARMTPSYE